jgi:hypothetical protein
MKLALPILAAVAALAPSVALACPYAAEMAEGDCGACSASLLGYGASLLLGLGLGFVSVAFERRRAG